MGELGQRVGVVAAVALSALATLFVGLGALLVAQRGLGGIAAALRQPPWLWTGGLLSALIILAVTVAPPRVGTAATVGIVIAGNLAMAAAIDQLGLFGADRVPLGWPRLAGLALLAAGSALVLAR